EDGAVNVLDVVGVVNVILVVGTCPPTTRTAKAAVSPARVWTSSETVGQRAKSVELPILVDTETEIRGAQFRLSYDPAALTPGQPQLTDRSAQMTVASNAKDSELTIVLYSQAGEGIPAGSGPILTIPFNVDDFGPWTLDFELELTKVLLAASCSETIPAEIGPISLKSGSLLPGTCSLEQNYPNPFNPATQISFQLPVVSGQSPPHVTLKIYNILGRETRTLVDEPKEPGYHTVTWDGKDVYGNDVASGIYFYQMKAGEIYTDTKRMLLVK
ncbi:MAG: FlgD immunoglobulin-like domain containing protein, partial [bacterium]